MLMFLLLFQFGRTTASPFKIHRRFRAVMRRCPEVDRGSAALRDWISLSRWLVWISPFSVGACGDNIGGISRPRL